MTFVKVGIRKGPWEGSWNDGFDTGGRYVIINIYNGNKYRWYEVFENGKRTDKIYRVVNEIQSGKELIWGDNSDLIKEIASFTDWD